jgi:hypothetical protein
MPNATKRAQRAAEPESEPDEYAGPLIARGRYAAAYSKWLHAVACLASESAGDDLLLDEMDGAEEKAASEFLAMHPPLKWMISYKFEVLERILEKEDRAGVRDREREMHALAAIKADLIFLGFNAP